jgi:16S rRNA (guanine(1405)-N(7))-methyltransferase
MNGRESQLNRLVDAVLMSSKYKNVCEDLIRSIGSQELAKRRNLKEAIKATKNKLHQVGGAYLDSEVNYSVWLDELKEAYQSENKDDFLRVCARIMHHHSSTRERLQILDQFYVTTLADLTPIRTVLDIACGLNPLSIPWMPLAKNAEYYAYDIYQDMIDFLNEFMTIIDVQGLAQACDVMQFCPTRNVDVAFIFKTIPCLEQVDKSASFRLLDTINADHLLVSFPIHSLGRRNKGMLINYEARFRDLVANKNWAIKRFEFTTELAFLVTK